MHSPILNNAVASGTLYPMKRTYLASRFCFFIACCQLIAPLATAGPARPSVRGQERVIQGPMIGAVTTTEATLWARLTGPCKIILQYGEQPDSASMREAPPVMASEENDFTVKLLVTGLKPSTTYYYTFRIAEGRKNTQTIASFRTAPASPTTFTLAFGSCASPRADSIQNIWSLVIAQKPDLFFWLGDNIYADTLHPRVLAEEYRRQRDIPSLQPLIRSVPNLAIWDDHDYGLNDGDRTNPIKEQSLSIFRQYWPNPEFGLPDTPGVFFRYNYGGVDFFFLDGRYHRDPNLEPDSPDKTMLGKKQFAWLKRELKASTAVFKVLISGGGWGGFEGPGGDTWASYRSERDRLFDFIRDEKVEGILLLSGDTHQAEVNVFPLGENGAYDLVEFVSSPLAQVLWPQTYFASDAHAIRVPNAQATNFGVLRFDLTKSDPVASYELVNAFGYSVYEPVVLRASQLKNGSSYWQELVDEKAKAFFKQYSQHPLGK